MKEKCVVLFSGGLDSRLAIKIMKEKNYNVLTVFFKLPFIKDNEKEVKDFLKKEKINLKIFDCTKGKLLQEYLSIVRDAKFGRGVGMNPCIDCKIFMFKKVKEFVDEKKINFIVSGEVVGQRPMSQTKKQIDLIEKQAGINGRVLRPLCDLEICGRRRQKQIDLARKFKINYPEPAGGCLLCEKCLKTRLKYLLGRGMKEEEIIFIGIGRHFIVDNFWVVLGRNEFENKIIEEVGGKNAIVSDFPAPSAIVFGNCKKITKEKVKKLVKAYSKLGSLKEREKFEKWRL